MKKIFDVFMKILYIPVLFPFYIVAFLTALSLVECLIEWRGKEKPEYYDENIEIMQ